MVLALDYAHAPRGGALGIHVAVDGVLGALFRYGAAPRYAARTPDAESFAHLRGLAAAAGVDPDARCVRLEEGEAVECLFRPDPDLEDAAWRRAAGTEPGPALCGLLHGASGEQAAQAVNALCLAPTESHDALICPSVAIRDAVRALWDGYAAYLNERLGGRFRCPVQLPVIPLGLDAARFAARATPEKRAAQRAALGIADDETVLLFSGRLSFATKAHPLPLFMAAERAASRGRGKLRLLMHGYFAPRAIMEPRFRSLAAAVCRTVRCDFVAHDDPRFPEGVWAAADIFTSLADNAQESFGLTPVEAMACGLPAVVSDWDGYRDAVRDGVDGFRVPTCAPPAGAGEALAAFAFRERNYGASLVAAAQSTALDIEAAAEAFRLLADDPVRRAAMGRSGQKRARDVYDWSVIIPACESLWRDLAAQRPATPRVAQSHPSFPNPWRVFAGYPSATLAREDRIEIVLTAEEVAGLLAHDMNLFIGEMLMPPDLLKALVEAVRGAGAVAVEAILASVPEAERPRLWRCVGWMLKHGVARRRAGGA